MRIKYVLVIAISAAGLLLSCHRTPDFEGMVSRLPELPPEFAGNLTATPIDSVLMTKSPPPVRKARPATPEPKRNNACTMTYSAYVVYPMTICSPVFSVPGGAELKAVEAQASASGWSPASRPERYYKLSHSSIARLVGPLFCKVSGGPWFASAITAESCDNSPDQSALNILGAPQSFSVAWSGTINDVPPPFNPYSFSLSSSGPCLCCPGFNPCRGACIPEGVKCSPLVPQ